MGIVGKDGCYDYLPTLTSVARSMRPTSGDFFVDEVNCDFANNERPSFATSSFRLATSQHHRSLLFGGEVV